MLNAVSVRSIYGQTLLYDWAEGEKINALLYLNRKFNEEICVNSGLFSSNRGFILRVHERILTFDYIQIVMYVSFRHMFLKNCNCFGFTVQNIERLEFEILIILTDPKAFLLNNYRSLC